MTATEVTNTLRVQIVDHPVVGTTAYLVDVRVRRYQALPAPLSGHAMLGTQASRTDPWTILAWDATGTWVVRVTPGAWTVLP